MTTPININKALADFQPSFKPGFETRVMEGIKQATESSYNNIFNNAFKRVFISGAAAVAILLISLYLNDGNLSADTLLGTSEMNIESYTAMIMNNF